MTQRGALILAAFFISGAMWCALLLGAIFAALHFWRFLTMLDAQGVLTTLMLGGGLLLIAAGAAVAAVGRRWFDDADNGWPLQRSSRFIVGAGALLMAAGAGAVLVVQAGA